MVEVLKSDMGLGQRLPKTSETPEEVFVPRRTLCLSPETLNALENADKLLENTEKQISQLNCDTFQVEDFEENGFTEGNVYIRNVVASMFDKGRYEPGPTVRNEYFKSKFTIAESSKGRSSVPKSIRIRRELAESGLEKAPCKTTAEECLICKYKKNKIPEKARGDVENVETSNTTRETADKESSNGRPEKLNLQKGPRISIKGDLSVKTSKIVDIHPDHAFRQISGLDHPENVVTFEFQHDMCNEAEKSPDCSRTGIPVSQSHQRTQDIQDDLVREKRANRNIADREMMRPTDQPKKPDDARKVQPGRVLQNSRCLEPKRTGGDEFPLKSRENSIEDYLAESESKSEMNKSKVFWEELEALGLDDSLSELSLREPVALAEMDSALEYQWKIIRQVQGATDMFDKFLTERLARETFLIPEKDEKIEKRCFNDKIARSDEYIAKKDKQNTFGGRDKIIELSKEIVNLSKTTRPSIFSRDLNTLEVAESNRPKADLVVSTVKEIIGPSVVDLTEVNSTSNSLESSRLGKIANLPEVALTSTTSQVFDGNSKIKKNKIFLNDDSTDVSDSSQSLKSNAKNQQEATMTSKSSVQSSSHAETISISGVDYMKSAQLSSDNNLDVNLHHSTDKSVSDILKSNDVAQIQNQDAETTILKHNEPVAKSIDAKDDNPVDEKNKSGHDDGVVSKISCREKFVKAHDDKIKDENIHGKIVLDQVDNNSQKTLHLIESVSDISSNKVNDYVENLSNSLRLSTLSCDKSDDIVKSKKDMLSSDQSNSEQSTESKIERQIFEARENLNSLMNSIDGSKDDTASRISAGSSCNQIHGIIQTNVDEIPAVLSEPPTAPATDVIKNILTTDHYRREHVILTKAVTSLRPRNNLSASRSFVTVLNENSDEMIETNQQHRKSILKKLDSCAIPSQKQGKQLFTSTVLADAELPGNTSSLVRFKGLSESSSTDTYSEGEIRMSSSTSYSAGEVKKA